MKFYVITKEGLYYDFLLQSWVLELRATCLAKNKDMIMEIAEKLGGVVHHFILLPAPSPSYIQSITA